MMRFVMSLVGISFATAALAQVEIDPLTKPIAPHAAARWLQPQQPTRIFGNTYLVGFEGLNVALIKTSDGLIVIDAGVPQGVAAVEANIRALGFALKDVKYILSTEPHYDHGGGLAALSRDTGAPVVASAASALVLRAGRSGSDDPQASWLPPFPSLKSIKVVRGGDALRLGDVTVKAIATPGHTAGSMSWAWRSCEGSKCANMVFGASLNPVGPESYRFSDPAHRPVIAQLQKSFRTMRALPCDILITSHPEQSGGDTKFKGLKRGVTPNPFIDPNACRASVAKFETALAERLAKEKSAVKR